MRAKAKAHADQTVSYFEAIVVHLEQLSKKKERKERTEKDEERKERSK